MKTTKNEQYLQHKIDDLYQIIHEQEEKIYFLQKRLQEKYDPHYDVVAGSVKMQIISINKVDGYVRITINPI